MKLSKQVSNSESRTVALSELTPAEVERLLYAADYIEKTYPDSVPDGFGTTKSERLSGVLRLLTLSGCESKAKLSEIAEPEEMVSCKFTLKGLEASKLNDKEAEYKKSFKKEAPLEDLVKQVSFSVLEKDQAFKTAFRNHKEGSSVHATARNIPESKPDPVEAPSVAPEADETESAQEKAVDEAPRKGFFNKAS